MRIRAVERKRDIRSSSRGTTWSLLLKSYRNLTSLLRLHVLAYLYFTSYGTGHVYLFGSLSLWERVGVRAPAAPGRRATHCAHAAQGACRISTGNRGREGEHQDTHRGRRPRQLFLTYRTERKALCRIRQSTDRQPETTGIGTVSGRERGAPWP